MNVLDKSLLPIILSITMVGCASAPMRNNLPTVSLDSYSEGAQMAIRFGLIREEELKTTVANMRQAQQAAKLNDNVSTTMNVLSAGAGIYYASASLLFLSLPTGASQVDHPLFHSAIIQQVPTETKTIEEISGKYSEKYFDITSNFLKEAGVKLWEGKPLLSSVPFTYHDDDNFRVGIDPDFKDTCKWDKYPTCFEQYVYFDKNANFAGTPTANYLILHRKSKFYLSDKVAKEISGKMPGFVFWSPFYKNAKICDTGFFFVDGKKVSINEIRQASGCSDS